MEISSSGIFPNHAIPASGARRDAAIRRETPPQEQTAASTAPLSSPTAGAQETLHRRAATAGAQAGRVPADLPRANRDAVTAYLRQAAALEQDTLETVYRLAGFDQYA